jgi:hypothetical protein
MKNNKPIFKVKSSSLQQGISLSLHWIKVHPFKLKYANPVVRICCLPPFSFSLLGPVLTDNEIHFVMCNFSLAV